MFLKCINPTDVGTGICDVSSGDANSVATTKALGFMWNFVNDHLTFKIKVDTVKNITRRTMLKQTAKMEKLKKWK